MNQNVKNTEVSCADNEADISEMLQVFNTCCDGIDFSMEPMKFNLLFTLLKQSGNSCNETTHSKMLAGIFKHDKKFLLHFLTKVGANNLPRDDSFNVGLEHVVDGRRIDVLIHWTAPNGKDHAVIIENKLTGAGEQPDQLNDYYHGVKKQGFSIEKVVFMPWTQCEPTTGSDIPNEECEIINIDCLTQILEAYVSKNSGSGNGIRLVGEYLDFITTLKQENEMETKALEIIKTIGSAEKLLQLEKLTEIVNSVCWKEARFQPLTKYLEKQCESVEFELMTPASDDNMAYYGCYRFEGKRFFVAIGVLPPNDSHDGKVSLFLACAFAPNDEKFITKCEFKFENAGDYKISRSDRRYTAYSPQNIPHQFVLPMSDNEKDFDNVITNVIIPVLKAVK